MRKYLLCLSAGFIALSASLFNPLALSAQASNHWAVGHWQGTLVVGSQELQILYHLEAADGGGLAGTMDVPAQGATGIPLSTVAIDGKKVTMTFPLPGGGSYEGLLQEGGEKIQGTFSQGSQSFPMDLARAEAGPPPKPQDPQPPFPYDIEDVAFSNRAAGIVLRGTITKPKGEGPFPGVVLVSGAGPHDRNGSMMGHQPFLVLADHLTRHGIAVLRFDDRGTAESGGDFDQAMPADLASDAAAAAAFLAEHPAVDGHRVGLAGHSEGGQLALLATSQTDQVAYLVMLAGAALPAKDLLGPQARMISEATGIPTAVIAQIQSRLVTIVLEEPDPEAAFSRLHKTAQDEIAQLAPAWRTEGVKQVVGQMIQQYNRPQTRFILTHDPRPLLEALTIPVLALFGARDLLVPPDLNAPEVAAALKRGRNADVTVKTLPGLNHLFQEAEAGGAMAYGQIAQTFSPAALELLATWIGERFGPAVPDGHPAR